MCFVHANCEFSIMYENANYFSYVLEYIIEFFFMSGEESTSQKKTKNPRLKGKQDGDNVF